MSIDLFMNDTCPECRKPIRRTTITPHATRRDLAIHSQIAANLVDEPEDEFHPKPLTIRRLDSGR
jgi:hypothetical protein